MTNSSGTISGYTYGHATVPRSPVSEEDLVRLKVSASFTEDDQRYIQMAGLVLQPQTAAIVGHWRSELIAKIPELARHSRALDGQPLPHYLSSSNLRFEQWIVDTCLKPYDQRWLDYQHEIALRHTSGKKNLTDGVSSSLYVPLRDIIAFTAVINETIKPYLKNGGHSQDDIERMHSAWCKSIQMQIALWVSTYAHLSVLPKEW